MKSIVLLALFALPVMAAAPKKPLPGKYAGLWLNSPFTTKPVIVNNTAPPEDPFKDWALGGVTKFPDGYFVILLNKKKPDERLVIQPGQFSEYKVLEVIDGGMDYRSTTVKIMKGSMQGIVGYEEKMLTLKAPPAAAAQPNPNIPGMPPGMNPAAAHGGGDRQPRLRAIVPPAPAQPAVPQQ
jgi:hypothetical protein